MNHLAIVVGDITDHGGSVISGAKTFFIDNVAVAHIGCEVLCPLHGPTRIVTGQNHFVVEGHPVAIEGDLTSCGARLISQQQSCFWIDGQPAAMGVAAYSPSETESPTGKAFTQPLVAAPAATSWTAPSDTHCDECFQFISARRLPLGHLNYVLLQDGQCIARGVLDHEGRSPRQGSRGPASLDIAISAPSPALE